MRKPAVSWRLHESSPQPEDEDEDMYSGNNGANESELADSLSGAQSSPDRHAVSPWSATSLRAEVESARRLAVFQKIAPLPAWHCWYLH